MSPLDQELLDILVCPETRRPLVQGDDGLVGRVNAAALAGTLRNRSGAVVGAPVDALLVRVDRAVAYPVRDDIPIMLIDESIDLAALPDDPAGGSPTP